MYIAFTKDQNSSCEKVPVSFTNRSVNAVRYFWNFGDYGLSTDKDPVHTYQNFGNYKIMLYGYDKDGCVDSSDGTSYFMIYETPKADFTYLPAFPQLPNALVNFTAKPIITNVNINQLDFSWNFGDSSPQTPSNFIYNPTHVYTKAGYFDVKLRVGYNNCYDSTVKTLYVEYPKPVVDFTPDTLSGCVPLTVHFNNKTTNVNTYRWIFNDGSPDSYEQSPTHVFEIPGDWDVTLIATGNGGSSTLTKKYLISSWPLPILDFYTNKTYQNLPNAVFNMYNPSNTIENLWYVSDSNDQILLSSTLREPSFRINITGRFDITLIGTNSYGCTDTLVKPNYISTLGPGYVYVPNAFSPNNNGRNEGFAPSLINVMERNYTFRVYNRWGEKIYETHDINGIWDGTFKGDNCQQDVYIWTVNGEYYNNDLFSFKGTVTLLK